MASVLEQLRPAQPGGRRRLHFDNGRWEDYYSIFVEHPSGRWDRILVARDDGEVASAIARAINVGTDLERRVTLLEAVAKEARGHVRNLLDGGFGVGAEAWLRELPERIGGDVVPSELGGTDG